MTTSVLGVFRYEEDSLAAAKQLKASGYDGLDVLSPIPMHHAWGALEMGISPVRRFSLGGAILGAICGFSLATACALVFIQPTGGRAIITFPPFLVITYELTILIGVLATLVGFFIVSRLPALQDAPYHARTIVDRFTVVVNYDDEQKRVEAERVMREAGAEDVQSVEIA